MMYDAEELDVLGVRRMKRSRDLNAVPEMD